MVSLLSFFSPSSSFLMEERDDNFRSEGFEQVRGDKRHHFRSLKERERKENASIWSDSLNYTFLQ